MFDILQPTRRSQPSDCGWQCAQFEQFLPRSRVHIRSSSAVRKGGDVATRRQFLKASAGGLLLARGLASSDVGRAAGEPGAGFAIFHLGSYRLPSSGGTQIKFGRRVPWQHAPADNKMYTIGGEVWQATNPAYHHGSPTLFRYDTVNHTLAVNYPYWGTRGVQPSHPDGVSLDPGRTHAQQRNCPSASPYASFIGSTCSGGMHCRSWSFRRCFRR